MTGGDVCRGLEESDCEGIADESHVNEQRLTVCRRIGYGFSGGSFQTGVKLPVCLNSIFATVAQSQAVVAFLLAKPRSPFGCTLSRR